MKNQHEESIWLPQCISSFLKRPYYGKLQDLSPVYQRNSSMVPFSRALLSRPRAFWRTCVCLSWSKGLPKTLPIRLSVNNTRGSDIISIRDLKDLAATITVGNPASSSPLAICPTDIWQTGQTGTSSTASAPVSCIVSIQRGRVLLSSRFCEQAPTKE